MRTISISYEDDKLRVVLASAESPEQLSYLFRNTRELNIFLAHAWSVFEQTYNVPEFNEMLDASI